MRAWQRFVIVDGAILAGWLATIAAVVYYEKGHLFGGLANPTATMVAPLEPLEQWFGIYYQDQKIGFAKTAIVPSDIDGVPGFSVTDSGKLAINLLGTPQQISISSRTFIDADWRLRHFSASMRTETYTMKWEGKRLGDGFGLTVTTPNSSNTTYVSDPTGSLFVQGLSSWVAFHRLSVGQSGKAWVLNPLALKPEMVYFYVRRKEELDGKEALVIETDVAGMVTFSWITPSGEVLKEVSPLGWELRQETQDQVIKDAQAIAPSLDILSATAIPIDEDLGDPQDIQRLVLRVEGLDPSTVKIERPWQRFMPQEAQSLSMEGVSVEEPWCVLRLERPILPAQIPPVPTDLQRYQQPSLFVQSDDSRIKDKARAIMGLHQDPWEKVQVLSEWVWKNVAKRLTVGLPSAIDILLRPSGDCHEHTILFTALSRSVGLPTRMVAGLTYQQGRFYYHAWPEVWLGEWMPTDPTLGQPIADPTHIGLTEAENTDLVNLGKFVGQLRIRVLERYPPHNAPEVSSLNEGALRNE